MTDTTIPVNAPPQVPDEWREVVARHLDELGGKYVPLRAFTDGVESELDGWPAPATFDEAAWDRAWHR